MGAYLLGLPGRSFRLRLGLDKLDLVLASAGRSGFACGYAVTGFVQNRVLNEAWWAARDLIKAGQELSCRYVSFCGQLLAGAGHAAQVG